jgi:hypothetical protein
MSGNEFLLTGKASDTSLHELRNFLTTGDTYIITMRDFCVGNVYVAQGIVNLINSSPSEITVNVSGRISYLAIFVILGISKKRVINFSLKTSFKFKKSPVVGKYVGFLEKSFNLLLSSENLKMKVQPLMEEEVLMGLEGFQELLHINNQASHS